MDAKVLKVNKPIYDAGSYARNPANHVEVEFTDGEKVDVRIGDGDTIACGLCYQAGQPQAEYGRIAIEAAEKLFASMS
jgi:hypothetical protein